MDLEISLLCFFRTPLCSFLPSVSTRKKNVSFEWKWESKLWISLRFTWTMRVRQGKARVETKRKKNVICLSAVSISLPSWSSQAYKLPVRTSTKLITSIESNSLSGFSPSVDRRTKVLKLKALQALKAHYTSDCTNCKISALESTLITEQRKKRKSFLTAARCSINLNHDVERKATEAKL